MWRYDNLYYASPDRSGVPLSAERMGSVRTVIEPVLLVIKDRFWWPRNFEFEVVGHVFSFFGVRRQFPEKKNCFWWFFNFFGDENQILVMRKLWANFKLHLHLKFEVDTLSQLKRARSYSKLLDIYLINCCTVFAQQNRERAPSAGVGNPVLLCFHLTPFDFVNT